MRIGYVRVSTVEQNEARQLEGLKKHDIEKIFQEKISGKDMNRPELQNMLDFCREGDTIYVHDFSRLARSTKDLLDIIEYLSKKGVNLVSNKENVDTSTPQGRLMVTMLAAIYQFERENILERQREGIAIAKKEGKYKGRKPVEVDSAIWNRNYQKYMSRQINKGEFAKALKVSRPTLERMLKEVV